MAWLAAKVRPCAAWISVHEKQLETLPRAFHVDSLTFLSSLLSALACGDAAISHAVLAPHPCQSLPSCSQQPLETGDVSDWEV